MKLLEKLTPTEGHILAKIGTIVLYLGLIINAALLIWAFILDK